MVFYGGTRVCHWVAFGNGYSRRALNESQWAFPGSVGASNIGAVVCAMSLRGPNWHDPGMLNEMPKMLEHPAKVTHVNLKTDGKGALKFLWSDEGVLLGSLERATPPQMALNKACRLSGGVLQRESVS